MQLIRGIAPLALVSIVACGSGDGEDDSDGGTDTDTHDAGTGSSSGPGSSTGYGTAGSTGDSATGGNTVGSSTSGSDTTGGGSGESGSTGTGAVDDPCEGPHFVPSASVYTDADVEALAGVRCMNQLYLRGPVNSITTLKPLVDLEVLGDLTVEWEVQGLPNLEGLEKLTELNDVELASPGLTSLAGLENVTKLRNLSLASTSVSSLAGLASIETVTGSIQLGWFGGGNPELQDISDLSSLTGVTGRFTILFAPKLTSSTGLGQLTDVDDLRLGHTGLTELTGLGALQNARVVSIYDNAALPTCQAQQLVSAATPDESLVVGNLVDGCSSGTECDATDLMGEGGCDADVAYHWDGGACALETGCSCTGTECDAASFGTADECQLAYNGC